MNIKTQETPKIAFLVHEPTLYSHYSSVWAEMDRDDFVIILLGAFSKDFKKRNIQTQNFIERIQLAGYKNIYIEDVIADGIKFKYCVSNHVMAGTSVNKSGLIKTSVFRIKNVTKRALNFIYTLLRINNRFLIYECIGDPYQYLPLQIGGRQIRFMYGADLSDEWSLAEWNEIYDLFLCHGPNDEELVKKRFKCKTLQMGYPRYDQFFSTSLNVDLLKNEFNLDPKKETILWMPTMDQPGGIYSSLPFFCDYFSEFVGDYNFIVRPHPITLRMQPSLIKKLEGLNFIVDKIATREMSGLFKLADYIICDQGGSAFGALYLGKKVILLELAGDLGVRNIANSSNLKLRDVYPTITQGDPDTKMRSLLLDSSLWRASLNDAKKLSHEFFADYRGTSSKRAADILRDLDFILN